VIFTASYVKLKPERLIFVEVVGFGQEITTPTRRNLSGEENIASAEPEEQPDA
jgi:hypothetical protein